MMQNGMIDYGAQYIPIPPEDLGFLLSLFAPAKFKKTSN
jgi:hypothetical protein